MYKLSDIVTYENLYESWKTVRKTCKNKKRIIAFENNINSNLIYIREKLLSKEYKPNEYRIFLIYQPKVRVVMSQSIADKIVNHLLTNFCLIPVIDNKLIYSNVATRKGKGTSLANALVYKYLNVLHRNTKENIYCLKLDIKKYFYNIDHEILINKLSKYILDEDLILTFKKMLSETNEPYINNYINNQIKLYQYDLPIYGHNKGLGIGAVVNQFFAVFYLNDLDHYIKEVLKCKYYIRYMDDFVIFDTSKERLLSIWKIVEKKLNIEYKLELNKKSNIYSLKNGINFLGYNYKMDNKLNIFYDKKTYKRINKRLNSLFVHNKLKYYKSYNSYLGYFRKIENDKECKYMSFEENFSINKEKYKNYVLLILEHGFFKTMDDDALIIHYLFKYKIYDDKYVAFPLKGISKVTNKFNDLNISYCFIDENINSICYNDKIYDTYKNLATDYIGREMEKTDILSKIDHILIYPDFTKKLKEFLDATIKEIDK